MAPLWQTLRGLSLLCLLLCMTMQFKGISSQKVERTSFDKLPDNFFYFKDSQVLLWLDASSHSLFRSEDQGKQWNKVTDIADNEATYLYAHPYDHDRAYILGKNKIHWKTIDQGKTWQEFSTPVEPAVSVPLLSFHAERSNYLLFTGFKCKLGSWTGVDCHQETYYTLNNFEDISLLRTHTTSCIWTLSSKQFENAPVKEIMCVESPTKKGLTSVLNPDDLRLVQTEDFFHTEQVVDFGTGQEVKGVMAVSAIRRFIVAVVKSSPRESDMKLYISQDGENWHETVFPEGADLHEKSFTIVESSDASVMIDVLAGGTDQFGSLYKSNSNGTFFVKSLAHTNRNALAYVDFERIKGVEGVLIANVIANIDEVESHTSEKQLQTRMSFDDGATWQELKNVLNRQAQPMKCQYDECALHLHSVTSNRNMGQITSSQSAVGVMMGVGSYGKHLLQYDECDTYLSTDGGLNWRMVSDGAHKYEFGDMGTLLVMIDDEKDTDHLYWSQDRGDHWNKLDLGVSVRARILTTDPESTSRSFILVGSTVRSSDSNVQTFYLDFSDLFSRQCVLDENNDSKSDFERWYARDLTEGPDCLMGHEQMFYRRKANRECYIGRDFEDPVVEMKDCPCTRNDYECDYNFTRDADGQCVRVGPDFIFADMCKSKNDVYAGSSGYRLIPGNTCIADEKTRLDKPVDRTCGDNVQGIRPNPTAVAPSDDQITKNEVTFDTDIDQFLYLRDSETILVRLSTGEVWRTPDQGLKWNQVLQDTGHVHSLFLHEFDNSRVYAIMTDALYISEDQGNSWRMVKIPLPPSRRAAQIIDFHPTEKDWLLFIGQAEDVTTHSEAFISRNNGNKWSTLDMYVDKCIFGRDSNYKIEKETIYCSAYDKKQFGDDLRLVRTTDWGASTESYFDNVVEFFVVEDFMAVASSVRGELLLYVSIDGKTFAEAQFPPDQYINRNTFTVLQSTTHAILLNIFKSTGFEKAYGSLYKSNENGTYYHLALDNTNGNEFGYVDFEKMQSVEGVILANQVWNADELSSGSGKVKKVRTMISWDDGGLWLPLKKPDNIDCNAAECTLNLHSRSDIQGPGAIFSTSTAPGLAMGVGNVGSSLIDYSEGDTFLTRDGGHNWVKIQDGEHLYEFGDQGSILALIPDDGPTNSLLYSWDQGETWHSYQFTEEPIRVTTLTTDSKSSTLKFVIIGHPRGSLYYKIITVDFSNTKQPKCIFDKKNEKESDFEKWIPQDDDGDDACLLGQKTAYWRRKRDRTCVVKAQFQQPEVIVANCECRDIDFECDFGFWRNDKNECVLKGRHPDRPSTCKPGDTFKGRSGYKKNTKSVCKDGLNMETEKEWECGERGGILTTMTELSDRVLEYIYFTDTDRVLLRTIDGKIWKSDNDGYSWKDLFPNHKVISVYQNPHFEQRTYFLTEGDTHFMTVDKGYNFDEMRTPLPPILNLQGSMMSFHNDDPDYLIFIGEKNCNGGFGSNCHSEAFYSHDNGRGWASLGTYMRSCIWGRDGEIHATHRNSIFCEQYHDKSGNQMASFGKPLEFISSHNYFHDKTKIFDDIVGVTVFGKFMVVAASKNNGASLRLFVSLDGNTFAPATFPSSSDLSPEAFTIMESANSMWIHVSTNTHRGSEYGTIFTSNSNGTYFVSSLENANRNEMGIVDFEKMQGIEGIAIANVVTNPGQTNHGSPKKLVTKKTVDAGGQWSGLAAPPKDSKGERYECRGQECSLHLHCYSERQNSRDLFSLSSAVGLMVGVGNVGTALSPYRDGDMFLTRDAGKTWNEIAKGAHLWEFADQGALLILVDNEQPTNYVRYTTNEGLTWDTFEFTKRGDKVIIEDIMTQPDGTSQKYILLGLRDGKTVVYHIDFSSVHMEKCKLDLDHPDNDDFELWSPEGTRGEKCLFGRETQYFRRIQDRDCYIGEKLVQPRSIVRNCSCTEADYECDFNYVRDSNNKCVLVPGLSPVEPECDGTIDYYYTTVGYRKIAASTCEGGLELDKQGTKVWCPGVSHSSTGWLTFIFVPMIAGGLIFALVRYRKKLGSGSIRLPDSNTTIRSNIFHTAVTKIAAAIVVIPIAIVGILSRIPIPTSLSDIHLPTFSMPSFASRGRPGYHSLSQDEHTDVLLEDYDGSDAQLIDEAEALDDADEYR